MVGYPLLYFCLTLRRKAGDIQISHHKTTNHSATTSALVYSPARHLEAGHYFAFVPACKAFIHSVQLHNTPASQYQHLIFAAIMSTCSCNHSPGQPPSTLLTYSILERFLVGVMQCHHIYYGDYLAKS